MNELQIGVVGKANVGKSTFFKAATLADVEIANYPFATIKPNTGVGYVRVECVDKDFNTQCNPREGFCVNHVRFVPVQLIDVAGLVPGAHEGKGMGNQFLDDLRQADALIHVIDVAGTTNEKGEPIAPGSYDPVNDVRFLEEEIDLWYVGIINRMWDRFSKTVQQTSKDVTQALAKQLSGLSVDEDLVKYGIKTLNLDPAKPRSWTEAQLKELAVFFRHRTKKMIVACNKIDVPGAYDNFLRLKKEFPNHIMIPCSSEAELALREASKAKLINYVPGNSDFEIVDESKINEKQGSGLRFIRDNVLKKFGSTGVQETLDRAVFELLNYIAIFPGGVNKLADSDGNVLPDCFLMKPSTTALDFAFKLHSDFGNNFIKAVDVKKKLPVGKEHKLKHRDVIEIFSSK